MWEHPVIYYRWGGISTKQNTLSPQLERDIINTRYKYHQTLKKILPKDYRDVLPYYMTWIKTYIQLKTSTEVYSKNYSETEHQLKRKPVRYKRFIWRWLYRSGKITNSGIEKIKNAAQKTREDYP